MMALVKVKNSTSKSHLKSPKSSKRNKPINASIFNLLKMKPTRIRKWRAKPEDPDLVTISMPRFNTNFGRKLGNFFNISPTYNINLEKYGSAVWRLCNGKVTVEELGEVLSEQYGDEVEPLYERLSQYLTFLERNKLIEYKKYVIDRRQTKSKLRFVKNRK